MQYSINTPNANVVLMLNGRTVPVYYHGGRYYIESVVGAELTIDVTSNLHDRQAEILVSVDGRHVLRNEPANFSNRGMVVRPYGTWNVQGWLIDDQHTAPIVIGRANSDSVAAQTAGSNANAEVIGIAIFPEYKRPVYRENNLRSLGLGDEPVAKGITMRGGLESFSASSGTAAHMGDRTDRVNYGKTQFTRADEFTPATMIEVHYKTREWLVAHGIIGEDLPSAFGGTGYGNLRRG